MAEFNEDENYTIERKIILLEQEGYPKKQATAIALDMMRRGKLQVINKPIRSKQEQVTAKSRLATSLKRAIQKLGLAKLGYDKVKSRQNNRKDKP